MRFLIRIVVINVIFPNMWKLEKLKRAKMTFRVTQGPSYLCRSMYHIVSLPLQLCLMSTISCTVSEIISVISRNLIRSC